MLLSHVKKSFAFLAKTDGDIDSKIIRSGFWVGLSKIIGTGISVFRSIILARLLTPEIFGLMSICMVAVRGLEFFTQTGFYAALVHRQDDFQEAKDTAYTLMILRGLALALITFAIAPFMASFYDRDILDLIIKILAITFIFKGFYNINTIGLEKELDFKRTTYIEQSSQLINFIIIIILAFYFRNIWALVIGQLISSLLEVLLSFLFIPGRPRCRFNKHIAKELFAYGKFITGLTIVLFISAEIDNLVIGKVLGMDFLGYYVIAFTIANLPATHISKIISKIMFPAYSKLQNDFSSLRKLYLKTIDFTSKIALPASFGIAILAHEIITILYGSKWSNSIDVLKILSFLAAIRAIASANGYVYNAIGKPHIPLYINSFKLILIATVIYPLTVKYGIIGTATAITIPHVISFFLSVYFFNRVIHLKLSRFANIVIKNVSLCLIMYLAIFLLKLFIPITNVYLLIFYIGFGALLYSILNINFLLHIIKFRTYPNL